MSDDVWEGDDTSTFFSDHAQDLDLFTLSNEYKELWDMPKLDAHHQAIDLLIAKGLNYDNYDKIMKCIVSSIGRNGFTKDKFVIKDSKLREWGLSNDKISGIRKILDLPEVNSKVLCRIKEGGIYLVKAFKIFHEEEDDVFLSDDYNIRRNISVLFLKDKIATETEARQISQSWQGYRSQISKFLYRMKQQGATKLLEDKQLTEEDFYGGKI